MLHGPQFVRLAVVCEEVALAMKTLDLKPSTRAFGIAAQTLSTINAWDQASEGLQQEDSPWGEIASIVLNKPEEKPAGATHLDEHLMWASGMRARLLREGWRVDLSADH